MQLINNCYKHNRNTQQTKSNIPLWENINIQNDLSTFAKLNIHMLNIIAKKRDFVFHNGEIVNSSNYKRKELTENIKNAILLLQ